MTAFNRVNRQQRAASRKPSLPPVDCDAGHDTCFPACARRPRRLPCVAPSAGQMIGSAGRTGSLSHARDLSDRGHLPGGCHRHRRHLRSGHRHGHGRTAARSSRSQPRPTPPTSRSEGQFDSSALSTPKDRVSAVPSLNVLTAAVDDAGEVAAMQSHVKPAACLVGRSGREPQGPTWPGRLRCRHALKPSVVPAPNPGARPPDRRHQAAPPARPAPAPHRPSRARHCPRPPPGCGASA